MVVNGIDSTIKCKELNSGQKIEGTAEKKLVGNMMKKVKGQVMTTMDAPFTLFK